MEYRYYLLGERVPIRVAFNEQGLKCGAEAPNRTTGQLEMRHELMSRVEQSPEVREISKAEFTRRCALTLN